MSGEVSQLPPNANLTGSRRYILSYVGNSIRKHKARSLSLLLGIVIGVALVSSVFVWTDTGSRVAIDDYFNENLYQYSIQQRYEYPVNPSLIFQVQEWLSTQYLYESSHVVYHSVALLGVSGMSDSDPYLPHPYTRGIKDAQTFLVENAFLNRVREKFTYQGTFQVSPGQCLVSHRFVEDVETILNTTLTIGDSIDIALAQTYPETIVNIGEINRLNITNIRIAGIYSLPAQDTVLYNAFQGRSRANYPASGLEQIFGWNDGLILHQDQLTPGQRDNLVINSLFPKLLTRLNTERVMQLGIDRVPQNIRNLKAQLEVAFQGDIIVGGERQLLYLEQYIAAYQSRQTMAVLVAPVIILSVFLTTFATNIFLSGRRAEVAILRARGASFRQLYAAFIFEFIVIGIIALVLGIFFSLFIGSLIPASIGFLQFDMTIFFEFFAVVRLQPLTWIIAIITCLIPPLIFTMIYVRSFLRTEIYQAMVGISPPSESELAIIILYFFGCVALLALFFFAILLLPATPGVAILQFVYAVVIWTLLSDSGSRMVRRLVAGATKGFRPVFGEKVFIFEKSMRTRRERIVPLLLILTLTFSVTVFAVVEAQTVQVNAARQVEYYIGGDLRVESGWVPISRSSEIAAVPGVNTITPMVRTWAFIGSISFYLFGVDASNYKQIGRWDPTSMVGEDPFTILSRLESDPDGIIFPSTLSSRLGKGVGQTIGIRVFDQGGSGLVQDHIFNIIGIGRTAPGLGYFDPEDPLRPSDITNGFQFQETQIFAFVNLAYLQSINIENTQLFLVSTTNEVDIEDVEDQVRTLGFPTGVFSPYTFSLEEAYPDGYLFNRGVVSILSIGFLACLLISIIALTLFVGVIVSERQTEYAIMRAVGSTQRQIVSVVIGEFIGLILTSFIVALFLGFAFSWLLMNVLLNLYPFPFVVPFPIVIPIVLLLSVLGIVMIGMSIGTYIPARRAGRTNVGRVLRNL